MTLPKGVYRAGHIGSLLRPAELIAARLQADDGKITQTALRELEDKHIATAVKKQIESGLRDITDGDFRRFFFHYDFLRCLDGVEYEGYIGSTSMHKRLPRLAVVGKLAHVRPIQVDSFKFLQEHMAAVNVTEKVTAKVCIPSPTMLHFRNTRDKLERAGYPTLDIFFQDLARVYQEELDDLYKAGCRFVQLDDTNLAYLCDQEMRKAAEERHGDISTLADQYAKVINDSISKRPEDMVIGIHLCRGNYKSQWFAQGGYEPIAEVLFKKLNVDVYFLEFDDARSGDFTPLRHVSDNKIVALGLMSSKKPDLDDKATVIRRLKEAAEYCPRGLDQLCLTHQCGFSSSLEGNNLTQNEQWAKIRLETAIAKEVWGDDLSV